MNTPDVALGPISLPLMFIALNCSVDANAEAALPPLIALLTTLCVNRPMPQQGVSFGLLIMVLPIVVLGLWKDCNLAIPISYSFMPRYMRAG
jgi:hypothetical protein